MILLIASAHMVQRATAQKAYGSILVPRASEKEGQVRLDYSPAPTQLAPLSPICFPRSKRPMAATRCNPR
jgi:hypothetical protein